MKDRFIVLILRIKMRILLAKINILIKKLKKIIKKVTDKNIVSIEKELNDIEFKVLTYDQMTADLIEIHDVVVERINDKKNNK